MSCTITQPRERASSISHSISCRAEPAAAHRRVDAYGLDRRAGGADARQRRDDRELGRCHDPAVQLADHNQLGRVSGQPLPGRPVRLGQRVAVRLPGRAESVVGQQSYDLRHVSLGGRAHNKVSHPRHASRARVRVRYGHGDGGRVQQVRPPLLPRPRRPRAEGRRQGARAHRRRAGGRRGDLGAGVRLRRHRRAAEVRRDGQRRRPRARRAQPATQGGGRASSPSAWSASTACR